MGQHPEMLEQLLLETVSRASAESFFLMGQYSEHATLLWWRVSTLVLA